MTDVLTRNQCHYTRRNAWVTGLVAELGFDNPKTRFCSAGFRDWVTGCVAVDRLSAGGNLERKDSR